MSSKSPTWRLDHAFFGIELSVAALADTLATCWECREKMAENRPVDTTALIYIALFGFLCIAALFFLLSTHQDWEHRKDMKGRRAFWLFWFANLLGCSLLVILFGILKPKL